MSKNYDLKTAEAAAVAAPEYFYQPPAPKGPAPKIGLIGCGGITEHHLKAYQAAGWEVAAFFDPNPEAAENRRREFYPDARVCTSVDELLENESIGVVDIATHPKAREDLIVRAADAGKHILSQKPFAVDMETGRRLVAHAARSFFPGQKATAVSATLARFAGQSMKPPLLASATVSFPQGMATLAFNGGSRFGACEICTVVGTERALHAVGGICEIPCVEIHTEQGVARANPDGSWFPDGFRGCMGELLCAIEENREPENSAADNLQSLAIVLGAMKSADQGCPVHL